MDKTYLIVLGDVRNKHYIPMTHRMDEIGESVNLTDNIYLLSVTEDSSFDNMIAIRNHIAGEDFGYCMVFPIDKDFTCAWNIPQENNILLSNTVKERKNERK